MSDHLGIIELGDVCAGMRAHSIDLFRELGAWITTTTPGELQRLFAEACHRHAWHAELWQARTPVIPGVVAASVAAGEPAAVDGDGVRRDRYRRALSALEESLRSLRARVDPVLDPSTARTIDLIGSDVVEIAARLDALRLR